MKDIKEKDIIKCKVTGLQKYGAFVNTEENHNGLIHISEISYGYVKNIEDYLHIGDNLYAEVINVRFLKPLDKETIKKSIEKTKNVITMEDGTEINGLGTAVEELIVEENLQNIKMKKYAWPDEFIRHGSVEELEKIYCDFDSIL